MSKPLVSLREAAEDFNAGKCQLQTEMLVRIGDAETRWELTLDAQWASYDYYGRPVYHMFLHRADITLGEPELEPDALSGAGPRDVDVIAQVFGIDLDARVWTKSSLYDKE